LARAGEDVALVARGDRAEYLRQNGITINGLAEFNAACPIVTNPSQISEADVLITNPTHYAIALRYRKSEAAAPIIVAMGVDHLALKMRQRARDNDVIQIENRQLARGLYAAGKVGQIIPDEYCSAVAQVLAVVYKRQTKRREAMGLGPGRAPGMG
jgi:flagellar biosynthesis protein FlhB